MVDTIKFSEMTAGGDLAPNEKTPGLLSGANVLFNNPFPLLAPGSTLDRPAPDPSMYFRLRFNTTLESYEYYSPTAMDWVQLEDSLDNYVGPFVTFTSAPDITGNFDLGTLTDGILKQTVLAGVSTPAIAINGTDYYGPGFTGWINAPAGFDDINSVHVFGLLSVGATGVNYLAATNSATGDPVLLQAAGTDTDIGVNLYSKAAGPLNLGTTLSTNAVVFDTGTAYQHQTRFTFANTANIVDVTWQDVSGTVAYIGDLAGYVQSVTGTANEIDVDNTDPQNPILALSATMDAPGTFTIQTSTAVDEIINDDTMATATATNLATALSIKNYVDGLVAADVQSVTGTANEIDVDNTDPQNPILSLSPTLDLPGTFNIQASTAVDEIINDDTMATATATNLATALSIKNYVDAQVGSDVTSATGTANQVLVNGTSGTPQTGAITLTLPQDIAPTSSPEFVDLTLTGGNFLDTNGNIMFDLLSVASSVNHLRAVPSVTGFPSELRAVGTDTNVGFVFRTQAAGAFEFITQAPTSPFTIYNGTLSQHSTVFTFANTAQARTVTFQDADGTLAFVGDLAGYVQSVTGTANQIDVDNTDPQNPILSLSSTLVAPGTIAVGNLLLDTNTLSSTDTNGDLILTPNGTGDLVLDGLNWPQADGTAGYVLATDGAGQLSWVAQSSGNPGGLDTQIQYNNSGAFAGDTGFTTDGAGNLVIVGSLNVDNLSLNGNTLSSTDTNGDLVLTPNGTGDLVLDGLNWPQADGTAGYFLQTDGAGQLSWQPAGSGSGTVSSGLINEIAWYAASGTTVSGITTANSAIFRTDASGVPGWSASLTDGQLLIGDTSGTPVAATLTAGPGISISNAAGAITISGTGSGIGWTEVTGTTQAMVADNGYVANNGALVVFTLPATAAFGTVINLVGKGAGGWRIDQNASQNIQVGSVSSTVGTGGSVASTNQFDSLELLCTTANTTWTVLGGPQTAGFTIV